MGTAEQAAKGLSRRLCAALGVVVLVASATVSFAGSADAQPFGRVLITEFVASNDTVLLDEDGDAEDWIELFNPGARSINLGGWTMTDDADDPAQWALPATTLGPGQYLVVFASDKDRSVAGTELHTNFKLSAGGEYLGLYRPNGTVSFQYAPEYPPQVTDVSYGLDIASAGYYAAPTPGEANAVQSPGFAETVSFDLAHGFYWRPKTVTMSTPTPGSLIRYTTDGSVPSTNNGRTYTRPIRVDRTTTLRAASIMPGFLGEEVTTATYFFATDIITQPATAPAGFPTGPVKGQVYDYGMDPDIVTANRGAVMAALTAIPSVSIVADPKDLFGASAGIYSNPWQSGREWERPASVELIDPSGSEAGFKIDAGLRVRGGSSRRPENPKHSLRLFFRGEYGGDLDYPLFGDEGVSSFEKIDLRTAQTHSWSIIGSPWNTFLRDVFSRDTQADLGHPYTRSRYYHLYLNGQYWGLYQSQERISKEYAESYFGGDEDDYDVVKHGAQNITDATDGDLRAWQSMWPLIQDQLVTRAEYSQLERLVDFESLIDVQLLYSYTAEVDASPARWSGNEIGNNWYAVRNRNGVGEAARWQFFAHDAEQSLGATDRDPQIDRVGPWPVRGNNSFWSVEYMHPAWIHQALLSNPDYVELFQSRADELFRGNGVLTPAQSQARWDEREAQVAPVIVAESARWGDAQVAVPRTTRDWASEVAWVENNWFPGRSDTVLGQLGAAPTGLIGQTGSAVVSQPSAATWHTVSFDETMNDPVVTMTVLTLNGAQPIHARTRNITSTGFEFQLEEWNYLDGLHVAETVHWVAVERGEHVLEDGAVIQAGSKEITEVAARISFGQAFDTAPVVIGQIASEVGGDAFVDRLRSIGGGGFTVQASEEEALGPHLAAETFHWIAFEAGTHQSFATATKRISHVPASVALVGGLDGAFMADMQTRDGVEASSVRLVAVNSTVATAFVQEERSHDAETTHAAERIGFVQTASQLFARD